MLSKVFSGSQPRARSPVADAQNVAEQPSSSELQPDPSGVDPNLAPLAMMTRMLQVADSMEQRAAEMSTAHDRVLRALEAVSQIASAASESVQVAHSRLDALQMAHEQLVNLVQCTQDMLRTHASAQPSPPAGYPVATSSAVPTPHATPAPHSSPDSARAATSSTGDPITMVFSVPRSSSYRGEDPSSDDIRCRAVQLLAPYGYQNDPACIERVTDWIHEGTIALDPYRKAKLVHDVVTDLTKNLTFVLKQTHVGHWIASATRSVALLRVFRNFRHVGSSLNDAALYDAFIALFPTETRSQLGDSKSDSRSPEMLFSAVNSCFPDQLSALQSAIQAQKFKQHQSTTFVQHLTSNLAAYKAHYVRQPLTVQMYLNLFQNSHRLDCRQRPFARAIEEMVLQDVRRGTQDPGLDPWHAFQQEDLQHLLGFCHQLDSFEAQMRNAHPSDDGEARLRKLEDMMSQLSGSKTPRSGKPHTGSQAAAHPGQQSAPTSTGRKKGANRRPTTRNRGRREEATTDSSSPYMSANPSKTIYSGSAVVSSGTMHAASCNALRNGRTPTPFALAAKNADDALLAAVTRQNRALNFSPVTQEKTYSRADPPAAVQNAPGTQGELSDRPSRSPGAFQRSGNRRRSLPIQGNKTRYPRQPSPPGEGHTRVDRVPDLMHPQTDAPVDTSTTGRSRPRAGKDTPTAPDKPSLRRRSPLRADAGDTCEEADSPAIQGKRAALRSQPSQLPNRFANALLRSPLTLALADLLELLHDEELTKLLAQLSTALQTHKEASRASAFHAVLASAVGGMPASEQRSQILELLDQPVATDTGQASPANQPTWAAVAGTPAEWQQIQGRVATWNVDHSKIRRCKAALTTNAEAKDPLRGLDVVFDEGCEVCTITHSALQAHFDDWAIGHAPFSKAKDIGPPRALFLQKPMSLHSFDGGTHSSPFMVLIHLKLGHAVYPVHCLVVPHAPGDIVLGLPFRRRYDIALPLKFKVPSAGVHQNGLGVTHTCLGVPKGYGVSFPRALEARHQTAHPSTVAFRQVIEVSPEWITWRHTGKELAAEALRTHLRSKPSSS
jgi:hypothetical protein